MRMFYRTAPVFMALSVALAGCSDADSPGSSDSVKPSAGSTATAANSAATTEVCLTVDGMH